MPGELNDIRVTMMIQGRNCTALLIIKIHPSTHSLTDRMRLAPSTFRSKSQKAKVILLFKNLQNI